MLPQHPEPRTRTTNNESFQIVQFEALSLKGTIEHFADSYFITNRHGLGICAQLQQHGFSGKHVAFGVVQAVILQARQWIPLEVSL